MSDNQKPYPSYCPDCGAKMIDDAWEIIDISPQGPIEIESIHPAWVCSDKCGFYIDMKNDR